MEERQTDYLPAAEAFEDFDECDRLRTELRRTQRELRAAQFQIQRYKSSVQGKDNMGRILSEEKARRELYLNNLLRVMPEIVLFLNEELNVVMCSESYLGAANMQSYDEIIGSPGIPDRLDYPEEQPREVVEQELFQTMWNKEFLEEEIYFTFVKGTPKRYYKKYTLPICNRDGEPAGVILLFNDMTNLIAARKNAERASESKSAFLANMSHEIRTPMNAIIGMTNIAKSSEDPMQKDYCLNKIESASSHLLGVINDILDMSKIESGKLAVSSEEFDFEKMLLKITNVVGYNVEKKRHVFKVELDAAIPQYIRSDDQRLAQVITNLLSNAVKFTPEGGRIVLKADLTEEKDEGCTLRFEVRDSGIGINEEQQGRLFNSFEQADGSTSRQFGGTGLGLAISKRIVEMLGGRIWVESQPGAGSRFIFTIKARRGREGDRTRATTGVNWSRLRAMAVDDDPDVLAFFENTAGRIGFACDAAVDADAALALMDAPEAPKYDIIFVDKRMPVMDGLELTRNIRRRGGSPVVIMISALEWSELEAQARSAGVNGFIPKPLFTSSIVDTIQQHCSTVHQPADIHSEEGGYDFSSYRILLAEDMEINREILTTLLEPTGISVDCAENGHRAVEMFAAQPDRYDAIFMDIHMPKMDGYEAARTIRKMATEYAARVPIIAMTANVFREDVEKCHNAGMDDHLGKPLDIEEVERKLAKYLARTDKSAAIGD